MQMHNLLTTQQSQFIQQRDRANSKSSNALVPTSALATPQPPNAAGKQVKNVPNSRASKDRSRTKSKDQLNANGLKMKNKYKQSSESILNDIQAMIHSQDVRNQIGKSRFAVSNSNPALAHLAHIQQIREDRVVDKKFKRKEYVSIAEELYNQKMTSTKAGIDFSANPAAINNSSSQHHADSNKENEDASHHKNVKSGPKRSNMLAHVQNMRNIKTGQSRVRINKELAHLNLKTDDDLRDIEVIKAKRAPRTTASLMDTGGNVLSTRQNPFAQNANQTQNPNTGFTQQTIASQLRRGTAAKQYDSQGRLSIVKPEGPQGISLDIDRATAAATENLSLFQVVQLGRMKERVRQDIKSGGNELRQHKSANSRSLGPVLPPLNQTETNAANTISSSENIQQQMVVDNSQDEGIAAANFDHSNGTQNQTRNPQQLMRINTQEYNSVGAKSTRSSNSQGAQRYIFRNQQDPKANTKSSLNTTKNPAFITQDRLSERPSSSIQEPAIMAKPSARGAGQGATYHAFEDLLPFTLSVEQEAQLDRLPPIWHKLFIARQKDLQLSSNIDLQLTRFTNIIQEMVPHKLILKEMGFGAHSAKCLAKIFREDNQISQLDVSMNNLSAGLRPFVEGLADNSRIVSLKIKNNSIDGRKQQQEIFDLVFEHASLASLDLGNSSAVKNRNRIHNEGFIALIEGIVSSKGYHLLQELLLSQSSLTSRGLQSLMRITESGIAFNLQVLDLSNNDLGSDSPIHLSHVLHSLISLNLSSTKLGTRGAILLAQELKHAYVDNGQRHFLRHLDLSYNKIGSPGFLKILSRLKNCYTLESLNFSGNDLFENQQKFVNLEKFLGRNTSCKTLLLNACNLRSAAMHYLGLGLQKNFYLTKLGLSENDMIEKDGFQSLIKGLLENKADSKLVDLDLYKCRILDSNVAPLIKLIQSNFRLRSLNLKSNSIGDEAAQDLMQAVMANEFITKVHLELNPIRYRILKEIEAATKVNLAKVNEQEVPSMIAEILDVKKKTAQSLFDCTNDPYLKDKMALAMPKERHLNLIRTASRGGTFGRRNIEPASVKDNEKLLDNQIFHSYDVIEVTTEIARQLKSMKVEREKTAELYHMNEQLREAMMEEDTEKWRSLREVNEELMDVKRELEFEIIMLDEQNGLIEDREEKRLDTMRHKIETTKLNQQKLSKQIAELNNQRAYRDIDFESAKERIVEELKKELQRENVAKIIYETYLKDKKRTLDKIQKEEELGVQLAIQAAERKTQLVKQREMAEKAEADRLAEQQLLRKRKSQAYKNSKRRGEIVSQSFGKDAMGMNSPRKQSIRQSKQRPTSTASPLRESSISKKQTTTVVSQFKLRIDSRKSQPVHTNQTSGGLKSRQAYGNNNVGGSNLGEKKGNGFGFGFGQSKTGRTVDLSAKQVKSQPKDTNQHLVSDPSNKQSSKQGGAIRVEATDSSLTKQTSNGVHISAGIKTCEPQNYSTKDSQRKSPQNVMSFDIEIDEKQSCEEQSLRMVPSRDPSMLKVYMNGNGADDQIKQEAATNSNIIQDSTAITIEPTHDTIKQHAAGNQNTNMVLTQSSLQDLQEDQQYCGGDLGTKNCQNQPPVLRQDTFKSVASGKVHQNYKTSSNFAVQQAKCSSSGVLNSGGADIRGLQTTANSKIEVQRNAMQKLGVETQTNFNGIDEIQDEGSFVAISDGNLCRSQAQWSSDMHQHEASIGDSREEIIPVPSSFADQTKC